MERRIGHKALKFKNGELVFFDPHPVVNTGFYRTKGLIGFLFKGKLIFELRWWKYKQLVFPNGSL